MSAYHLAQPNIAKMKYEIDAPEMVDFVANLDKVNVLAEASKGFVWRLQTDEGDATSIRYFGDDFIVNMSVWQDVKALHDFVYRPAHTKIMARRKAWFDKVTESYSVLWWVAQGKMPSLEESKQKPEHLRQHGASAEAFTFKTSFAPPN